MKTESSCGSCTLCCKIMEVPELNKPRNAWCDKCDPKSGCTIHAERPQICRDYECLWLQSQARDKPLGVELRPDRTHVILATTKDGKGLLLHVDIDHPDAHKRGPVKRIVDNVIRRGDPVLIACGEHRGLIRGG